MSRRIATVLAFLPVLVACIPRSAVMSFDRTSCPSGWSEYTNANGRAIIGLQAGGALGGKVGIPLINLEGRTHSHTLGPAQVRTSPDGEHAHIWGQFFEGIYEWRTFDGSGNTYVLFKWNNGIGGDGTGIFPLARTVPTNLPTSFYTNRQEAHSHDINVAAITSDPANTGDVMPYVQLLVCSKD